MYIGLGFDTETTGLPDWKKPSGSENQPHIVQLAAVLVDLDTGEELQSISVIVKPDGWVIPQETIDVHGITNELANEVGIPESTALGMFINLYNQCDLRIAHNTTFDNRIIRIALKRYMPNLISDEEWKNKDSYFCTLMKFRKIKGGKSGHKLEDAYEYYTGQKLEGAHNAMIDTRACMEIYFAMQREETPF